MNIIETSKVKKISLKRPSTKKVLFLLFLGSFLVSFSLRYFILYADIFSAGLGGMVQGVSYTLWETWGQYTSISQVAFENVSFWIINLLFNVPIFIFAYMQFGKNFFRYSVLSFILSAGFGFIFSLVIPFNNLNFFNGISTNDPFYSLLILIASTIGGLVYGIGAGLIFSIGACTMGTDPISKYISRKYKVNINFFTVIFSLINSIVWITVSESIEGNITSFNAFMQQTFFSIRFLGTILFLGTFSIAVNYIYPSLKRFQVSVNSTQLNNLKKELKEINFHRTYTIYEITGGFSNKKRNIISFIINSEELYDLLDIIFRVDSEAFVDVKSIKRIYGLFSTHDELWDIK